MSRWTEQLHFFITNSRRDESAGAESKLALLRGQFALLIIFVGLSYIIIDSINRGFHFIPWYLVMMGGGAILFVLNRNKKFVAANIGLFLLTNTFAYLFAAVDHPQGGVFFFFFLISMMSVILVGYRHFWLGAILTLITILLAMIAYLYDLSPIPPPMVGEAIESVNFMINFTVSMLFASFMLFFLMRENYKTEETLRKSEKTLFSTSDELIKSRERFELAIKGTKAGIYEWRSAYPFTFLTPQYKRLLGYEPHELNNMTFDLYRRLVFDEDWPVVQKNIEAYSQETMFQIEIRLRTKSGAYRWFQDNGICLMDKSGKLEAVVGSIADIHDRKLGETELNLKNAQLAKTNEELDRFVYSASHDMRAPLSSVLGLINIAKKSTTTEEITYCLDKMTERIMVMEGFIKDVTDYSRNSRVDVNRKQVNVLEAVTAVKNNLRHSFDSDKISMGIDIPEDLFIYTDIHRLTIILNNLVSNSTKYYDPSKQHPHIQINARVGNGFVSLSVADNGVGISAEHLPKVFDMFYRASENSEGSGLGLYIVRETLQKLGGTIDAKSQVGLGSTFTFVLPIGHPEISA